MNDDAALLDARIRRELQALPALDEARVAAALAEVTGRGRPPAREPWLVALVAAVVVGVLVLGPQLFRAVVEDVEPAPAPSPGAELRGTWSRALEARTQPSWSGEWKVTFADGGVLGMTGPVGARSVTDGAAYAVTGAQVRVDAFVNSVCYELAPGAYTWVVVADGLRLTPLSDDCAARVELLAGTWRAVP